MEEALLLCQVKGHTADTVAECSDRIIRSKTILSSKVPDLRTSDRSTEMVLMASTAGSAIMHRIADEVSKGNAALGLILDATASTCCGCRLD